MGKDKDYLNEHGYTKVEMVGLGGFGKAISQENGKNVIIRKVST